MNDMISLCECLFQINKCDDCRIARISAWMDMCDLLDDLDIDINDYFKVMNDEYPFYAPNQYHIYDTVNDDIYIINWGWETEQ